MERVIYDFGAARVVSIYPHTLRVEKMERGQWKRCADFDTMSDDYAHSNARDYAARLAPAK